MELKAEKIKVLGRGAYGVVHLVKTTSPSSQLYAVKSADAGISSSLRKERDILCHFIGCPNIVQCYGGFVSVERDHGKVFNVLLEYASGGSLLDLMVNKYGGKVPECDAKEYARMILQGLAAIHRRAYVHSDLKPENILVFPSQDGSALCTLKIADFGLAKQLSEKDTGLWEYGFRGTAVYMSPESITGEISGALDVWSVGCIIVTMISGKLPLQYHNLKDLRDKLLRGESPEIPKRMSRIGRNFLKMCFARDLNKRWTAAKLLRHPFLLPEETLFPFRKNYPQCNLCNCSTCFQDRNSFQSPKGFPLYNLF